MAEDEEARQRAEINMFAKMAAGGTFSDEKESAAAGTTSSQDMFTAAANAVDDNPSGTFALSSSPNAHKAVASSNLDAAVAAFAGEADDGLAPAPPPPPPLLDSTKTTPVRPPLEPTPMYAERVMLARPLFYGPLLAPRVIQEAREAVTQAMQELNLDPKERPPLGALPPHIRNMIGAIESFGFGIDIFSDSTSCRGSEYVSTFQPVFGDVAREERAALERLERAQELNTTTDPSAPPAGETTQEEKVPTSVAGQSTSGDQSDSDRDTFLQWVSGAAASDEPELVSTGSYPQTSPSRNLTKSALSRAKSAPAAPGNVDKDLFSQWARGKPKTPPDSRSPNDRDLFSRWAQTDAHESPTMTPLARKGKQAAAAASSNPDISEFSQWARGEDSDSPREDSDSPTEEFEKPQKGPDKDMFSQWAQGGGAATPPKSASDEKKAFTGDESSETNRTSSDSSLDILNTEDLEKAVVEKDKPAPMSDRDTFAKWALGDQDAAAANNESLVKNMPAGQTFDTFRQIPTAMDDDSDDDSVDRSELKKKVGRNEGLEEALKSLVTADGSKSAGRPSESMTAEDTNLLLSQMGATTPGGRPLSNLEVTNGAAPIFGCDDTPLPTEGDLGIFQTKEEQSRNIEQRRSQEMIDKKTSPNIFGPVACPNPALGPDDTHSWNSRTVPCRKQVPLPVPSGRQTSSGVPVMNSPPASTRKKYNGGKQSPSTVDGSTVDSERKAYSDRGDAPSTRSVRSQKGTGTSKRPPMSRPAQAGLKRFGANTRFGWWNINEEDEKQDDSSGEDDTSSSQESPPLQLPPTEHAASANHVVTRLTPTPEKLREENLPLSYLHSATSTANALPFLSDRPPSFRYLQIDTEAVGFPSLGAEIEPLFCSLAIYHVEPTISSSHDPRAAPVPNMQRCGRVTEVLSFDVVRDSDVEGRCINALWPYASSFDGHVPAGSPNDATQGSRCGVFPLASNLNITNLYAILIVHKVLADKSDVEPYTGTSKAAAAGVAPAGGIDIGKLRDRAEKVSRRHGQFLMPFAFGVAPLLQIFGTDVPTVVSSRAVQIPLFRFITGQGDRPIIDHIMVMLYPRADHQSAGISGPAPLTNGGTAMLVMRYFGYLGLHSAVFSKSTLARHRLVDFSGEIQVRRRNSDDEKCEEDGPHRIRDNATYFAPPWHTQFLSEPVANGGRNVVEKKHTDLDAANHPPEGQASREGDSTSDLSKSKFYAQELAPVPLQLMPHSSKSVSTPPRVRLPRSGRSVTRDADIEPSFYTTFCNEMLCHPRLLHNTPKGNIAVKVELREVIWNASNQAYLARLPKCGPSLHNHRRGPFLVQEAFTACSFQPVNAHFLDEFKIKLPLLLNTRTAGGDTDGGQLALFFSVYNVDIKLKRRWKDRVDNKKTPSRGGMLTPRKGSRAAGGPDTGANRELVNTETERRKREPEFLACGFLPITTSDTSCLIDNGLHDVKLTYSSELQTDDEWGKGTLLLTQLTDVPKRDGASLKRLDSTGSTGETVEGDTASQVSDRNGQEAEGSFHGSEGATSETFTESDYQKSETSNIGVRAKPLTKGERMTLQVRVVVHSSIHPQNATLNEFLRRLPDVPAPLPPALPSSWKLPRSELLAAIASADTRIETDHISDEKQKLLLFTIDVSKTSLCSSAEASSHFIRIFSQLMRTMVSGSGTPSLLWANPAAAVPLRLHAFATLLQIISSVNSYMGKRGATQLDGKSKWDVTVLGKIISMLFDEEKLFLSPTSNGKIGELFDLREWQTREINSSKTTGPHGRTISTKTERDNGRQHRRSRGSQKSDILADKEGGFPASKESFEDFIAGFAGTSENMANEKQSLRQSSMTITGICDDHGLPSTKPVSLLATESGTSLTENKMDKSPEPKIDSQFDFAKALRTGSAVDDSGSLTAENGVHAFSSFSRPGRSKYRTMPSSVLGTIYEIREEGAGGDIDAMDNEKYGGAGALPVPQPGRSPPNNSTLSTHENTKTGDAVDTELVFPASKGISKRMRIPTRKKNAAVAQSDSSSDTDSLSSSKVPAKDSDIEIAGNAFLDSLGGGLGYSSTAGRGMGGEELRVGHAHHRKTHSRCSIDWSLPDVDLSIGTHNPLEQINSLSSEEETSSSAGAVNGESSAATVGNSSEDFSADSTEEVTTTMTCLAEEKSNTVRLPNYLDRLIKLGSSDVTGRWCPYAYEVIILQWVALLVGQQRSGDKNVESPASSMTSARPKESASSDYPRGDFSDVRQDLTDAALRAKGAAISCAPVLLEIIKSSIGWRVGHLLGQAKSEGGSFERRCPPLVTLDEVLLSHLEQLVSIITDACIDSRNFDTWEFRQTSIDVNDSIIRFLRDMFAFLDTRSVHRLILVYFSRFVVRDGKRWQDRDSKIGLRCSWEISKLRLNAVTALVRFPDFLRVNSPMVQSWSSWSMNGPHYMSRDFFSTSLEKLQALALPEFSTAEGPVQKTSLDFPSLKPHWLVEIVTDICLSGTEHAEQYIQHRAASLLHELFWSHSQEARVRGNSALVASMYIPFLVKVLGYANYLSSLAAKNQLRKDIIPCVIFVMQCAPVGLMLALWRKLCIQAEGKGQDEKFGGVGEAYSLGVHKEGSSGEKNFKSPGGDDEKAEPDIYDMFGLLNLALSTFEYEGCDAGLEAENLVDSNDQLAVRKKEFLLTVDSKEGKTSSQGATAFGGSRKEDNTPKRTYSTSGSRKWQGHDGSSIVIHTSRLIVREMIGMLRPGVVGNAGDDLNNEASSDRKVATPKHQLNYSSVDVAVFVRAATSVYLHALSLQESDIVIVKTLDAAVEIVKIFGIKVFLRAVGETLQHWMRVVSLHCGARRAEVRVQALEFLVLTLRLTWDSYGSFLRVRVPLLSVQTEVMERIVATATTRNYREQRRVGAPMQSLANDSAEASLSPLWRTLDRLHHQLASRNLAFRSALMRLAESMKKLYRAYIAAHALAIVNRALSPLSPTNSLGIEEDSRKESSAYLQSRRIIVHRIINASAGYSKQFLGLQRSSSHDATVAHNEAVEDAFFDAAYVFSPTELPSNRVAWLRKLAEFHASRGKFAEEATCRFHIHITLRQAARLDHWLWGNQPFAAWIVNTTDGVHLDGEGPAGEPEDYYDADYDLEDLTVEKSGLFEESIGRQIDKRNSFRRIFYRVANSVRMHTGDPEIGGNRNLFYGVTFATEYRPVTPWFSLREIEEEMVDEAELAGDLFLQAGIAESSRYAWSLATQIYAEKFNYGKLAHAYKQLANVVSSKVPVVDTNNQALELSHPLGRFYRVWFHGGAPDEINGTEFVYRAAGSVKLEAFGEQLSAVIRGILPENTPIDLVLDDGRPERHGFKPSQRRPLGPTPIEPVKIKVTPLRPLLKNASKIRGTPEWFYNYAEVSFDAAGSSSAFGRLGKMEFSLGDNNIRSSVPKHHARSSSASVFASSGSVSSAASRIGDKSRSTGLRLREDGRDEGAQSEGRGELVGVDKFSFLQPVRKERNRSTRDWLKSAGDIADKSLRVTQLQVEQAFPACIARQTVMHRSVFTQSPLEAGADAVCSWCSVLFRTAVATNGMAVLGAQKDHGIGTAAAKVVADCIHSSRVKEMGLVLLKKDRYVVEEEDAAYGTDYCRMVEEEVNRMQTHLARAIVIFMEILHLLIARNRDLLLEVMEARKRGEMSLTSSFHHRGPGSVGPSTVGTPENSSRRRGHSRLSSNVSGITSYAETDASHRYGDDASAGASHISSLRANERTDKAIAVQSELQRAFIAMAKALYSNLTTVLGDETPRWLKEICRENYFSSSAYRLTKIRMADEICFYASNPSNSSDDSKEYEEPPFQVMSIDNNSVNVDRATESPSGSQSGRSRSDMKIRRTTSRQSESSGVSGDGSFIFHV